MKHDDYSVAQARDHLAKLVHEAERGRPIRITRRGKPAAVLISEAEFRRVSGRASKGLGDAILAWRAEHNGVHLTDTEIGSWRDRRPGDVPDLSDKAR